MVDVVSLGQGLDLNSHEFSYEPILPLGELLMLPTNERNRGKFVLAVVISLSLHGLLALGWFSLRPARTTGIEDYSTRVEGPDDHELIITLREPAIVVQSEPKTIITPPAPPPPLPSSVVGPPMSETVPASAVSTGASPPTSPALPKAQPGKPLHGKLKAGKTIVYALDRSSSMGSDGLLRSACRAIKDSLGQLSPESRFQIVAYNSSVSTLANEPLPATERNILRAKRWLDELVAEGSSDHRGGVREAISFHPDAVVLLTDADDLEEREVLSIRALLREPVYMNVAIFGDTRPTGETPLERLMEEVGGKVRYVER